MGGRGQLPPKADFRTQIAGCGSSSCRSAACRPTALPPVLRHTPRSWAWRRCPSSPPRISHLTSFKGETARNGKSPALQELGAANPNFLPARRLLRPLQGLMEADGMDGHRGWHGLRKTSRTVAMVIAGRHGADLIALAWSFNASLPSAASRDRMRTRAPPALNRLAAAPAAVRPLRRVRAVRKPCPTPRTRSCGRWFPNGSSILQRPADDGNESSLGD